jgi:cyclohexa-1,5-dienecarbonyl-CoA hydratase
MADPLIITPFDDGAGWRVTICGPVGNILNERVVSALTSAFTRAAETPELRVICLEGSGQHFSYGASVQEHLPDQVAGMLARFRELLFAMLDSSVVAIAAVRGRCLGGGLELVTLCHRVVAHRDAQFGQPEVALGVFAPFASVLLPERIGRGRAEDLCLTGRTITAEDAARCGLVDEVVDEEPADTVLRFAREHLVPQSAMTLRCAVQAIRADLRSRLEHELPGIERLYLDTLMRTEDAREGLHAFLEKRSPRWQHR